MKKLTVGFLSIAALAVAGAASAQSMPSDMRDALRKKYEIEEQRAEAERIRAEAEAERVRAQTDLLRSEASANRRDRRSASQPAIVLRSGDVMSGWDVPTYQLPNGVMMRFSGGIRPGSDWQCIAACL